MGKSPATPPLRRRAFTLVEILIVITILGIVAAIVVPHFTHASDEALVSNLQTQLQTIRTQLEIYRASHAQPPTLAQLQNDWTVLTHRTDAHGNVSPTGRFGPYLTARPRNPYTQSYDVVDTDDGASGWVYNQTTGEIEPIVPIGINPSGGADEPQQDILQLVR